MEETCEEEEEECAGRDRRKTREKNQHTARRDNTVCGLPVLQAQCGSSPAKVFRATPSPGPRPFRPLCVHLDLLGGVVRTNEATSV